MLTYWSWKAAQTERGSAYKGQGWGTGKLWSNVPYQNFRSSTRICTECWFPNSSSIVGKLLSAFMSFSMSSIKITLNRADGSQQTFVRSVEKGGGDGTAASALASLRTHMGDVQSELNAALTVLVDKEKAASATSGKVQDTKRSGNCLGRCTHEQYRLPHCHKHDVSDAVYLLKPVLNWANVCSPEHTSDTSTNYDSFLNWTVTSPNMVRTVQTLLHSQLACNEMQASARTCGRRAEDSMIENVG